MKNGNINIREGTKERSPCCRYWWITRTKVQRRIILVILILAVLAVFFAMIYLLLSLKIPICTTPSCVRLSMEFLDHIDEKANPCEDFYKFACGKFLQNTNLNDRGSRSDRDKMEDGIQDDIRSMLEEPVEQGDTTAFNLAKKFYRACINESAIEAEGLKEIKEIFRQIGGWPTLDGDNWREKNFDWINATHRLRQLGANFDFFFRVSVDADPKNNFSYILGIHDVQYSPSEISSEVKDMYLDYMVDIAVLFGARPRRAKADSSEVLKMILRLAELSEESTPVNNSKIPESLSLSELNYRYGSIPWEHYINGILSPIEKITYDDTIMVADPAYLEKLGKFLNETSKRTLANFIAWHILQHLINYTPAKILDRAYEYLAYVNRESTRKERWKTCIKTTKERMEPVISAAYISHFFDEKVEKGALELIQNIKTHSRKHLLVLPWLDEQNKKMALRKLWSTVEEIVSYRDLKELKEESELYTQAKVNENKLIVSALELDFVSLNIEFGKLRKTYRENWLKKSSFITGHNINYSPKENILRFPIGIFRGIYYESDRPEYMNYGILGSIIAHEISHIFIEAECGDLPGELRSWWSPKSLVKYAEKLQCLTNQYGNFVVAELGKHLNPLKTREEDMADLAGMKVSYDTYINWVQENGAEPRLPGLTYSPYQLFWISSAIRHCSKYSTQTLERDIANHRRSPQQFRVNGPLQNLEEFAHAFGCPEGSKMNPKEKCVIWGYY